MSSSLAAMINKDNWEHTAPPVPVCGNQNVFKLNQFVLSMTFVILIKLVTQNNSEAIELFR
jgi:hypothetical protein